MSVHNMTLTRFREALSLAVNNTLEYPEMIAEVTPYGYSQEVLEAVRAQLETFTDSKAYKHARYGFQKAATAALLEARKNAHRIYMQHVTIARIIFRGEPGPQTRLGLRGRRAARMTDWMNQVRKFYSNALGSEEIKARLAERGISEDDLIQGRERIRAIGAMKRARANEKGLAQQSTSDRNVLRRDLAGWLSDYHRTARIAFAGNPEWLERIGLLHRST